MATTAGKRGLLFLKCESKDIWLLDKQDVMHDSGPNFYVN